MKSQNQTAIVAEKDKQEIYIIREFDAPKVRSGISRRKTISLSPKDDISRTTQLDFSITNSVSIG